MRAPIAWISVCLACWPAVGTGAFDPTDAFQFNVNVGVVHDNNLFRLRDDADISNQPGIASKSDTLFIKGAGIKFETPISRQRVIAEWNISETTFDNNSNLDHSAYDGRLAWLWRIGNDLNGEANYRKRRTLGGFADEILKEKDLVDTETYQLTGGYRIDARWRVSGEVGKEDVSHGAFNRRQLDVDAKSAGARLTYRTPADNFVSLYARRYEREYPNLAINDHQEDRVSLIANWRLTGLLRLDASAGYVDVNHDRHEPGRDFSGFTWRAAGIWDATGKMRVTVTGFRDLRLYEDVATSYIVVDGINISPVYSITSKVTMQGDFVYEKRDFRGVSRSVAILDPRFLTFGREDDFRLFRLGVVYQPLRNIDLTLVFETGERKSNQPFNSYDYQSWFATARVNF